MINSRGRPFGSGGCQVPVGQGVCGETRTLDIINEFKRLYEGKMHEIDTAGGGDCLQEKVKLQQEWISDLSDQNEMLVRAVEELEREATQRVRILEDKLQKSAQCLCEVMKRYREYDVTNDLLAEPLQKTFSLENDQKNLLEFIRRVREENDWSVDGLKFFDVTYKDLFGSTQPENDFSAKKNESPTNDSTEEKEKAKSNESSIKELEVQIEYFKSFGDVEGMAKELKCKTAECENLKTSMADSQQALVEEIAAKHDQIVQLRRDCQQLEDRCIQADKQTAFRDDIIKELRKEIKQLKQQTVPSNAPAKYYPTVNSTKRNSTEEPYLVINHTRKIVQSGRSTVIYLKKDEEEKPEQKFAKNLNTLYERQAVFCYNCKQKFETDFVFPPIAECKAKARDVEDEKSLHLCKSENDLYDFKRLLKPVKDRTKLTVNALGRCNTFVGNTKDVLRNVDFEGRLKQRNVSVPSHVPVKLHVNNIESNKNKR